MTRGRKIILIAICGVSLLIILFAIGKHLFNRYSNCLKSEYLVELGTSLKNNNELEELKIDRHAGITLPEDINNIHQARIFYCMKAIELCPHENTGALLFLSDIYLYYYKDYASAEKYLLENHDKWPNVYTMDMLIHLYKETNNEEKLAWAKKERARLDN